MGPWVGHCITPAAGAGGRTAGAAGATAREGAGATGLVLHTVYLPLALRGGVPSKLTLIGGTHVSTSPCFHFLDTTWRGYMELLGLQIDLKMRRPGFYPRGGGLLQAHVSPSAELQGVELHVEPATSMFGARNTPSIVLCPVP